MKHRKQSLPQVQLCAISLNLSIQQCYNFKYIFLKVISAEWCRLDLPNEETHMKMLINNYKVSLTGSVLSFINNYNTIDESMTNLT